MGDSDKAALEQVYAAENPKQLAAAYAAWSNSYDSETAALGYCLPFVVAAWVARYVQRVPGLCSTPAAAPACPGPICAPSAMTRSKASIFRNRCSVSPERAAATGR